MQDPKFEQDVRRKMEELVLPPSDTVWANVDKAINPKSRRRVPFFWWLSAGGLLVLLVFLTVNYRLQNISSPQSPGIPSQAKISPADPVKDKTSTSQNESQKSAGTSPTPSDSRKNHIATTNFTTPQVSSGTFEKNIVSFNSVKKHPRNNAKISASGLGNQNKSLDPDKNDNSSEIGINENGKNVSVALNTPTPFNIDSPTSKPTANKSVKQADSAETVSNKANKTPVKIRTSYKWTLGFNLLGGASGVNKTLFQSVSNAPQNNNVFYPSANPHYSSTTKPSASFGAGFFLEKNFAPRWKLRAGLNYHYYSTQIETGRGVDSAAMIVGRSGPVASFYRDGSDHPYVNHYHFLEVPIELGFLVSTNKNWPIYWDVGIAASFLLHTNALHFDPFGAIYYQDKDYFTKTQFYATTDVAIGLPLKGIHLQVGPQVQYGFTNLLNHLGTARQHLVSGGLKLSISLGKK